MKINRLFPVLISLGVAMTGFTSCSDDDNPNDPNNPNNPVNGGSNVAEVFPEGLPANIGNTTFKTDDKGRVTEIISTYDNGSYTESVKFDYTPVSRATQYDMTMTYYYDNEPDLIFYIQLNDKGFIKHALEVNADPKEAGDTDTWDFTYNSDGQLNYMKRSENEEETFLTYVNGDMTKVTDKDLADGDTDETEIFYTTASVKNAIANKGGIMMFDNCFNIDMDEMDMAYYAGLLGKATKNLPLGYREKDGQYTYAYNFHWYLNADGLPTKMVETEEGGDPAQSQDFWTFSWK